MMSINELKIAINYMPIDSEIKESLLKNSEILIDFRDHLCKKYNISEIESEAKIKEYMSSNFKSGKIDDIPNIAYEYAINEGFDNSLEFKSSISELINLNNKIKGN